MIMCFILAWDRRERRCLRNSVSCTKNSKAQGLSGSAPHTVEVPCTILGVPAPEYSTPHFDPDLIPLDAPLAGWLPLTMADQLLAISYWSSW